MISHPAPAILDQPLLISPPKAASVRYIHIPNASSKYTHIFFILVESVPNGRVCRAKVDRYEDLGIPCHNVILWPDRDVREFLRMVRCGWEEDVGREIFTKGLVRL